MKEIRYNTAQFCEKYFYISKSQPFSLEKYPAFYAPYNTEKSDMLLMCSRQTGKSLSVANISLQNIAQAELDLMWLSQQSFSKKELAALELRPHAVINIFPTGQQASFFSEQKLNQILEGSPIFEQFTNKKTTDRVMFKGFAGNSSYFLASCFNSPNSIRGYTCDQINVDEIQDIDVRFLPIIFETQNRSLNPSRLLSGTPKTTTNTIAFYWKRSTQCEWVVKCPSCGKNQILGMRNIGLTGIICKKCGKAMVASTGRWVSFNPKGAYAGFRIHSLMADFIPWTAPRGSDAWTRCLLYKMEEYTEGQFKNEVLALPHAEGSKPMSEEVLKRACSISTRANFGISAGFEPHTKTPAARMMVSAGVDWGTSLEGNGKTVLNIEGYTGGKFITLFAKKYGPTESNPLKQIEDIIRWCKLYKVKVLGVDEGFGSGKNEKLAAAFGKALIRGNSDAVIKFSNSGNLKARREYNKKGMFYSLGRTETMQNIFDAIEMGLINFPKWEVFREFSEDILCINAEYNNALEKKVFTHSPDEPDDYMFALLYSIEAILISLKLDKIR